MENLPTDHPAERFDLSTKPPLRVTPRLSIIHLMLWMFCSGVQLGILRAIYSLQEGLPGEYINLRRTTNVMQGMIDGAVWAGAVILVVTWLRGARPMLREPGHWLLLVRAARTMTYFPFVLFLLLFKKVFGEEAGVDSLSIITFIQSGWYLIPVVGFVLAAVFSAEVRWRVFFGAEAIVSVFAVVVFVALGLGAFNDISWISIAFSGLQWGGFLLAGGILLISIVELSQRRRRDWLHWTGVASLVASTGVSLMWMIWSWFVRDG